MSASDKLPSANALEILNNQQRDADMENGCIQIGFGNTYPFSPSSPNSYVTPDGNRKPIFGQKYNLRKKRRLNYEAMAKGKKIQDEKESHTPKTIDQTLTSPYTSSHDLQRHRKKLDFKKENVEEEKDIQSMFDDTLLTAPSTPKSPTVIQSPQWAAKERFIPRLLKKRKLDYELSADGKKKKK